MPEYVRALIVILVLAVPAFYIDRLLTASVVTPREFAIWRNAWLVTTVGGFLSGSFFVFAVMATIICLYTRAVGAATLGFYFMLLFAVPLGSATIDGFGMFNLLFVINNARLLSIVLLFPILFAASGSRRRNGETYTVPDFLIVSYVLLLIVLDFDHSNVTQTARSATLLVLDILIPYFAFSRAVTNTADFRKIFLAFIIAALPLALIGLFEIAKGWHLYSSLGVLWGADANYDRRAGLLRASASTEDPIVFGFINMVAIGCALAVWQTISQSLRMARIAWAIFAAAVIASLSRGPWIGTVVLVIAYLATGPKSVTNLTKFGIVALMLLGTSLLTPIGDRLLEMLPFVGSIDAGSITYRQHLFSNAVQVIERNPWLGSNDYLSTPEMKQLIQGQGIVDLVNTYLVIALRSGLVGLGLFLASFATILIGLWKVTKFHAIQVIGLSSHARALMAIVIAILVTIATVSSIDSIPYIYWSFAGLSVALIRIAYRERATVTHSARTRRVPA